MAEYSYKAIKGKSKTFRTMTGIDLGKFTKLLPHFHRAYTAQLIVDGHDSETKRGRPGNLATIEDKLFFILYYLKTYPLQEVLGYSFGLSQGLANRWVHRLCSVLQSSLSSMGHVLQHGYRKRYWNAFLWKHPKLLGWTQQNASSNARLILGFRRNTTVEKKIPFGEEQLDSRLRGS